MATGNKGSGVTTLQKFRQVVTVGTVVTEFSKIYQVCTYRHYRHHLLVHYIGS